MNSKAVVAIAAIALIIAIGALAGRTVNAATPAVGLGTAGTFSVLAGTAVTNTGPTTVDRDVGVHPGTSVTGFPPGIVGGTTHTGDGVALQAQSDLVIAYNDAAGRTPFSVVTGDLGGQSLGGGVYRGGALGLTGVLTLDGQNDPSSVWIFQAASSLVTASTSYVSFVRGASPCNVFWQIGSSATLGTGSTFVGTIMALTSITVADGVTIYGRALARNGNVTLINDRFLTSACAAAPLLIPPTQPPFTVAPSITPTVAPTATPAAAASPSPAPTATPGATVAVAAPTVAPTAAPAAAGRGLPSTSTGDPLGPLTILGTALAGIGCLLLVRRPVRHL